MIIPTTIAIAAELPRLNLHTALQLRTLGTTILSELRESVISKEQIFINLMDFRMDSEHYVTITAVLLFLYGQFKYMEGHDSVIEKIQRIERFGMLKKITSEILFIIMIVFIKNVESVY